MSPAVTPDVCDKRGTRVIYFKTVNTSRDFAESVEMSLTANDKACDEGEAS